MGDVWRPKYYSRSPLPRSLSVERAESSVSRKRPRSSAPPRRVPLRYYSEDDDDDENNDVFDDGRHGRDDDDDDHEEDEERIRAEDERDDDDHEEDEEQIRAEDERDDDDDGQEDEEQIRTEDERGDEFSGGSDAEDVGAGVAEEQPLAEEEFSDDDRPISVVRRGSTSTATAPTSQESSPPADRSLVIRNVTVEKSSAFYCSICYHPLKSPIFQCTVGHVVCSACHDKLRHATACHVCRVPMPGGYSRCIVMEQVVDSIRFPCPHAAHGCAERPAYHDHDDHARKFKPCYCPGEGCSFVRPVQATLLEHFATVHGWPCSAGSTQTSGIDVRLRKGFNVVVVTANDDEGGVLTEEQYTLVLKVEQVAPVCNTITVFCIYPYNNGTVRLNLYYYRRCFSYMESMELNANGMPGPSTSLPFLLPASTTQGEDKIRITVRRPLDLA